MIRRALRLGLVWCALSISGCACCGTFFGQPNIDAAIQERAGFVLAPETCGRELTIPPGVTWEDRLTEDEAVAIALWNNAAFLEALTELGLVRADIMTASQLPNPELWLVTPVGVKQLEYMVEFPLEALWLRPKRVAVAESESARVAENLVQVALTLIRDVRVAYADVRLAADRYQIAQDLGKVRTRIAYLANERVKAGDASPVEVAAAGIDAQRAEQETARFAYDVELALDRLRHMMGLIESHPELTLADDPPAKLPNIPQDVDALIVDALSSRPDLTASGRAVESAQAGLRVARQDWFRFLIINDANGRGVKGFETGPGVRATIPIFNWNRGRISRAAAMIDRAVAQQTTLRDRIMLEVRQANLQWIQARKDLDRWQTTIHPAVDDAIRKAELAYREGDTGLALVLETTRQLFDSQAREAQLRADLRRAVAELERGVGHRLIESPRENIEPEILP